MENIQKTEELIRLTDDIFENFTFDPNIPTDIKDNEWLDIIRASAPLLLTIFGSPLVASEGIREIFDQLFTRLDQVEESLGRIEKSLERLEQKYDAAMLAKFHAGFREVRDGIRARKQIYK